MIIGISGKIGSGKDTVGLLIQYLTTPNGFGGIGPLEFIKTYEDKTVDCDWKIKKFADKLKDIVCMLLGCTREKLENREFKEGELGKEWDKYRLQVEVGEIDDILYFNTEKEAENYFSSTYEKYPNSNLSEKITCWSYSIERETMTPRKILQLLGTDCGRNIIHPNIWVNSLMADYFPKDKNELAFNIVFEDKISEAYKKSLPKWVITDTRFSNEAEAILGKGGIMLRVNRYPKSITKCTAPNNCKEIPFDPTNQKHLDLYKGECMTAHESETALDKYDDFTEIIDNNGSIEDLISKVKEILIKYGLI